VLVAKDRVSVGRKGAVCLSARLKLAIPARVKVAAKELKIPETVGKIFTYSGSMSAVTKTFGPFKGKITHNETGELIATLDDARVTATRMTGQQGQSFLMLTLEYFVTSHDWRTGDGRMIIYSPSHWGHEPVGASHEVFFHNAAGGTMYTWNLGNDNFRLECNDAHRYRVHHRAEHNFLGWFDDWAAYTHYVHGPFFRC
jgi:hypothetical protein